MSSQIVPLYNRQFLNVISSPKLAFSVGIKERSITKLSSQAAVCLLPKENAMISLSTITARELLDNTEFLAKLSELFSTNYGLWGPKGLRPGQPVIMGVKSIKKLLLFDEESCGAIVASSLDEPSKILGHAFYYKFNTERLGDVCWITQLVTHLDARQKGVSSSMIRAALRTGNYAVCGLVSSNPYAIRALETATSSKCDRSLIYKHASEVIGNCNVPYIDAKLTPDSHGLVNTQFHVDHTELLQFIQNERDASRWKFGELLDGHEFLAFTFIDSNKSGQDS